MKARDKTAILEGKKVYLRPLTLDDAHGQYWRWVNDGRITRYMGTLSYPTSRSALRGYLQHIIADQSYAFFAIMVKETEQHVGNIKLGPIDWLNRKAEFGRLIGNECFQGQGIGTEATALILQYGFRILKLHKITSSASQDNFASIVSNQKNGLKIEARFRSEKYEDGGLKDVVIMSILEQEYKHLQQMHG